MAKAFLPFHCGIATICWSPPLILTKENVDVALSIFDEAIAASV